MLTETHVFCIPFCLRTNKVIDHFAKTNLSPGNPKDAQPRPRFDNILQLLFLLHAIVFRGSNVHLQSRELAVSYGQCCV
ncbi:Hypothetical protein NTJ_06250 [Nesidiocoris tenuis]|uniref:Uncharacterized protein n=1 Tax=Nesidiocoris tenuis TaxID=355587 RepID=A0ABN7AMI3_9HEMI|nr:Hypothetical protein NTJ_06250 [Nesidiocoris tenuis]